MTDSSQFVVYRQPGYWRRVLVLLVLLVVLAPIMIKFLFDPPIEPIWGNSPLIPRLAALIGLPTILYAAAGSLLALTRTGPVLELSSVGLMSKTMIIPLRPRRLMWSEVAKISLGDHPDMLIFHTKAGKKIRVECGSLEEGWDRDRVLREIRRLSGGRIGQP